MAVHNHLSEDIKDDLIKTLLETVHIQEKGISVTSPHPDPIAEFKINLLLGYFFEHDKFDQKFRKCKVGIGIDTMSIFFHPIIKPVIVELKTQGIFSYSAFKELIDKNLNEYKRNPDNLKEYRFIFAFPIKSEKLIIQGDISNLFKFKQITFHDWVDEPNITNNYAHFTSFCEENQLNYTFEDYTYLLISGISARDYSFAYSIALEFAEVIFSFIVYHEKWNSFSTVRIGKLQPYHESEIPFSIGFEMQGRVFVQKYSDGDVKSIILKRPVRPIYDFLNIYRSADSSIRQVIENGLFTYYNGLIETNLYTSFLNFWITLDIFLLKTENDKEGDIIRRYQGFIPIEDFYRILLYDLYQLRNKIIHEGSYEKVTQEDRNLMKWFAGLLINWFIFKLSKYSKSQIQDIFNMISEPNLSKLDQKKEVIDIIFDLKGMRFDPFV